MKGPVNTLVPTNGTGTTAAMAVEGVAAYKSSASG